MTALAYPSPNAAHRCSLRSSVPDGDLARIIDIAVTEKLERIEERRFGKALGPRKALAKPDTAPTSRHIPAAVRRAVHAPPWRGALLLGRDRRSESWLFGKAWRIIPRFTSTGGAAEARFDLWGIRTMPKSILVVGLERKIFQEIDPLLSRSYFTVDRVARGKSGLALCEQIPFDLIIAADPLPDIDTTEFVTVVRMKGMPTAGSHLVALGVGERLAVLRRHVRGKDSVVLSSTEPRAVLEEVAARLLGVATRRAARIMVRLRVHLDTGLQMMMCQTDNISARGLLLRTDRPLPAGTRLSFEYSLPGDRQPIQGEAEVVRHTAPQVGEVQGMGLRCLVLDGDGAERLEAFLGKREDDS